MASLGQVKAAAYGAIGAGKFGQKSGLGFMAAGIVGGVAAVALGAVAPVAALIALPALCLGMFQRVGSKKIEKAGWAVLDATKGKGPRQQATGKESLGRGLTHYLTGALVNRAGQGRANGPRSVSLNHGQGGHVLARSNPRRFTGADFARHAAHASPLSSLRAQHQTATQQLRAVAKQIGPQHVGKTLAAKTPARMAETAKSEVSEARKALPSNPTKSVARTQQQAASGLTR